MQKKSLHINIKDIPQNVGDITDKVALSYFKKQSKKQESYKNLCPDERNYFLKKVKLRTLTVAALYGMLGVLLLYVPYYIHPDLLNYWEFKISYPVDYEFGKLIYYSKTISLFNLLYGFILVALEIWLLTLLDLKAVSKVAALYGFSSEQFKEDDKDESQELLYIGLGKEYKKMAEIGINPFQRISKAGVVVILLVFRLKALLSNFLFRIILKRILGRVAVRTLIELAGIPIYAFWNAYASAVVIRKINMRMIVADTMRSVGQHFKSEFSDNQEFKDLIYDSLEYIAITKKSYHPTDYIFAKHLLNDFDIQPEVEHQISEDYFEKIKHASPKVQKGIGQILLIGFLIDGNIGSLEKRVIRKLQKENIISYDTDTILRWTKNYAKGYGFDEMFNRN